MGAGARPFPVPDHVRIGYGDIRNRESLESFFQSSEVKTGDKIDAQTFAGLDASSLDFVISAHVIEHLRDPVGSIVHAIRILKPGGVLILVVPDLPCTFDRNRPETTVEHALQDYQDGGESTTHQAYEEHLRYVHPYLTNEHYPEIEIQRQAAEGTKRWRDFDIHFHAWTRRGFEMLLAAATGLAPFDVEAAESVQNENIFVLRKRLEVSRRFSAGQVWVGRDSNPQPTP